MKKRNIFLSTVAALTMAAMMTVGVSAKGWQKNNTGWWYGTNDANTTWHANGWQWIDGNGDGTAECYYFDQNGYMLSATTTPDGYTVNSDGAWTVNGAVQTKGSAQKSATTTTGSGTGSTASTTSRPSSAEIVKYLYRGRTDTKYFATIDTSKPEWENGVTNIQFGPVGNKEYGALGARWLNVHGGWYYLSYDGMDVQAIAVNDDGYLLADTTTPDGFYVNKRGVLEIDGREVTHCEDCYMCTGGNTWEDVPDRNHVDPNVYSTIEYGRINFWNQTAMPWGKLIYNHMSGVDRELTRELNDSHTHYTENDFGTCAKFFTENSYRNTNKS